MEPYVLVKRDMPATNNCTCNCIHQLWRIQERLLLGCYLQYSWWRDDLAMLADKIRAGSPVCMLLIHLSEFQLQMTTSCHQSILVMYYPISIYIYMWFIQQYDQVLPPSNKDAMETSCMRWFVKYCVLKPICSEPGNVAIFVALLILSTWSMTFHVYIIKLVSDQDMDYTDIGWTGLVVDVINNSSSDIVVSQKVSKNYSERPSSNLHIFCILHWRLSFWLSTCHWKCVLDDVLHGHAWYYGQAEHALLAYIERNTILAHVIHQEIWLGFTLF